MEPSRDDFVIAIRSAFLKKGAQQRFSLLSLIFFSIVFLILGSLNFKATNYVKIAIEEIVYRSSFIVSIPENLIKDNYLMVQNHLNLYEVNEKNISELKVLKSKNISKNIIEYENIKLKQLIDDYFVVGNEIFAKVLIDKKSPFLRSVIINKGSKNNIKLGMAVLDDIYFIGKVVEVNYTTSRVLLISDINSKIPVSLEPNSIQAIMSGNGSEKGIIEYISDTSLKNKNENLIVFTSGMAGLFKSGIPIGKINKKNFLQNIEFTVDFYKDLSQLKYVKILSFKKELLSSTIQAKEKISKIDIENLKNSNIENINFLKKQKEISEEIRIKLENQNSLLNEQLIELRKENTKLNSLVKKKNTMILQKRVKTENLKFLELNLLYGNKCSKDNFKNILKKKYKVGTPEYKACVLNKGKY
jgi:rod shape-determining protein MreC